MKQILCNLCKEKAYFMFKQNVLKKYEVSYYLCSECGFLQTEKPYWLQEAYSEAMQKLDIGIVMRNEANCRLLSVLLPFYLENEAKIIDCGAGYGILVRMLRDRGWDCFWQDEYAQNLFAKGFEAKIDNYKIMTLFEVMEHIELPLVFLQEKIKKYNPEKIIFSTLLFEEELPPQDWWYYALEGGQHISFYQRKTLKILAEKLGFFAYSLNSDYHFFSKTKISFLEIKILQNRYLRRLMSAYYSFLRRDLSKTWSDYQMFKRLMLL